MAGGRPKDEIPKVQKTVRFEGPLLEWLDGMHGPGRQYRDRSAAVNEAIRILRALEDMNMSRVIMAVIDAMMSPPGSEEDVESALDEVQEPPP